MKVVRKGYFIMDMLFCIFSCTPYERKKEIFYLFQSGDYFTENYIVVREGHHQYVMNSHEKLWCVAITHLSHLVGKPTMWFANRSDTNRSV